MTDRVATRTATVAVGLLAYFAYVRTLYPGLAGGDSGELVAAVVTGGVIHPPGYPLYALLGRLFVWGAGPSAAWRLNLSSALADAGAAAVLCHAVSRKSGSVWAGITAGILFAFAPGVWTYAVCAEVFALNNLVAATLLLFAVRYDERQNVRDAFAFAFVAGLGLSNHQTIVFVAAPLGAWLAWRGRATLRRPKTAAAFVALFAAGLLPYVYLPIASTHPAAVSWGDAGTWSGFFTHVLRREYGTFRLAPEGLAPDASALSTLAAWGTDLVDEIGVWALPLVGLGVVASARAARQRLLDGALLAVPALSLAVIAVLGNVPVDDPLHRGIVARFWQEPDLFLCAMAGLGLVALERALAARSTARWLTRGMPVAAGAAAASSLFVRFPAMDRHESTLVRSYGAELLRASPPGALLFTRGDLITNSIRALQSTEAMRPDVRVVDLELLGFPWSRTRLARRYPQVRIPGARYMPNASDGFTMADLLDANVGRFPVLSCGGPKAGDRSADTRYGNWPLGFCDVVHSGSEPVDVDAWIKESQAALPRIEFAGQLRPLGSWEEIVWKDYWEVRQARAAHLLAVAGADPSRRRYILAAADILSEIVARNPAVPPHVYKNLALALGRAGLDTAKQRARAAAAWRKYLESKPTADPQLPMIRAELDRLERRR